MMNIKYKINALVLLASIILLSSSNTYSQWGSGDQENKFYQIEKVKIPESIILEVGGIAFNENGVPAVCTRRGEIWLIENPTSETPTFKRFAHGLHEPLGLAYKDGAYYCTQRGELTKLTDNNGDGVADSYKTIYSWPLAANYHEYSYGPVFLPDGDMLLTLNLGWIGRGASLSKWRGWMIKVSPEGEMTPIATGMRSPAGHTLNAQGDVFYTENQGDWVGSGRMTHVESGDFVGNPEGLKWSGEEGSPLSLKFEDIVDTLGYSLYEYAKVVPEIKPPSVWFPHGLMGISTSGILIMDDDRFGPFKDQMLIGDQGHSTIMRVFQEKVKGTYQGICFPFREGFSSGVLRLAWGPDKSVYVGMTSRGWSSTGQDMYGLERLVWNKKTPFEIKAVRAMPDGFELEFTQPVDSKKGGDPASYEINDFTYKYHHFYGSPVTDLQSRQVFDVELSSDNRKARLYISGLRTGYINEIKAAGVTNNKGETLLHNFGYYTLNNIPDGEARTMDHSAHVASEGTLTKSAKRVSEMPASWVNGPDQVVTLTVQAGLKFDLSEVEVKAGSKIRFVLDNPDDMLHNALIVKPGTIDAVAQAAMELGLKGQELGYVPDSDDVLYHTGLLQPDSKDVIYFVAPEIPGDYPYVCTFPGHAITMRGVMKVK
ncbi:MAG: plastocyanin/azurin family copper-binding protein [Cyclobacteriaceae bacterium]|nr:plastocyanin/azurin family copper-binding protein [Cyclobacteriaceae bacterium]